MSVRRETVTVTIEELSDVINDYIASKHPELSEIDEDVVLEYASKTKYLLYNVIRPGKKQ